MRSFIATVQDQGMCRASPPLLWPQIIFLASFSASFNFASGNFLTAPPLTWGCPHRLVGQESACKAGRLGLTPGSGRFPWRRKWQPIPVFLPAESHGQRNLVGYSPSGHKSVRHDLASEHTQTVTYVHASENSSIFSSMLLLIFYITVLCLISVLQIKPTSLPLSASSSLSLSLLPAILFFFSFTMSQTYSLLLKYFF